MISRAERGGSSRELMLRQFEAASGQPFGSAEPIAFGQGRIVSTGRDIRDALSPARCALIRAGVAAEVRMLADGRCQILELYMPGDLLDLEGEDSTRALTTVDAVDATPLVERVEKDRLCSPIGRAWLATRRVRRALQRDHLVRLGRLSAYERLGHFLLEIHERLFHVGLANIGSFRLPLKQVQVGDLLGLSVVHVSRTTQQLMSDGLIEGRGSHVIFRDRPRLVQVTGYISRFAAGLERASSTARRDRPAVALQPPPAPRVPKDLPTLTELRVRGSAVLPEGASLPKRRMP